MKSKLFVLVLALLLLPLSNVLAYEPAVLGDEVTSTVEARCYSIYGGYQRSDADASDGYATYIYSSYVLTNPDGVIIDELLPYQVDIGHSDVVSESVTFFADDMGDYTLSLGLLFAQQEFNYDTNSWEVVHSGVCNFGDEDVAVTTVSVPSPDENWLLTFIMAVWNDWKSGIGL